MKAMNPTLAGHLREAARRIESGEAYYNFAAMESCNCGVLAQVVTGHTRERLSALLHSDPAGEDTDGNWWWGTWEDVADEAGECPLTGMPMGSVLRALGDAGLTAAELGELEFLTDPAVRSLARLREDDSFGAPGNAARYMRAWADLIDPPAPAPAEPEATRCSRWRSFASALVQL